jgi:membrane-associated phospholipid phosphatase
MIRRSLWWLTPLFCGGVAGVYLLFVRTGVGQRLDMAALAATGTLPDTVVSDAGSVLDAIGISTLAFIAFVIGAFAVMRGRYGLAISAAVVVAGSNLTTQVLKHLVLQRPHLIPSGVLHPNSYPSGHATVAASLAVAAFLVVPHRLRAPTALAATTFAAGVGVATIVAGWHRPSDVIGAWLVVGAWASATLAVLLAIRGSRTAPERDPWRVRGEVAIATVAVIAFGVFVATTAVWVWTRLSGDADIGRIGRTLAFVVAAAGVLGTALAVAAALVFALRRLTFLPPRA